MKFKLTSPFGELSEVRDNRPHSGIDLGMETGTELRSVGDGVIERVIEDGEKIGNGVYIRLEDGTQAIYGHLSEITVKEGQSVNFMDTIGFSGNTGNSTGPHLHFALKSPDGEYVDPTPFADGISAISGHIENSNTNFFLEKFNQFSDWVIGKETELVLKPFANFIQEVTTDIWMWFVANLPDIMGYGTIAAGVLMIFSSMVGKGGMIKTLAWWFGALILAICILGGMK
ncbi:M23 family metallopeptidase [Desertibacillus haloalkaliphilus]|uniref:M23 family metallopeptidase n=1 Tax=Desertibacillus haloalkaliphilus TaxID=1328930 RepID=UPI001C279E48|nr:M23 family metallopeptidase [Desertibacillus haloalkaliphilus]MBU8908466.1 M23 family metallopeptidase [Desertibacillus haloalkaliphilus]